MYKVIKKFHDLQDVTKTKSGDVYHEYNVGDDFPRKGREVSEERIAELAGRNNKQKAPLIALAEKEEKPETPSDTTETLLKKNTVKKKGEKPSEG